MEKDLTALTEYLTKLAPGGLCVAFSGGVDSAVILAAAAQTGAKVHALTMYTPFHSPLEPEHAKALAEELGAVHHVITMDTIAPEVLKNPLDRCYLCKKNIFTLVGEYAAENGLQWVVDGTNADDLQEYRPGLRALQELGVKSPLAELGIPKARVREMAAELGLSIAKKPSAPCVATRFPYDTEIDLDKLRQADGLENYIKSLGPQTVRARIHGDTVRIEVLPEDFPLLLEHRGAIVDQVHQAGFPYVTLDLEGFRSGSMDLLSFWEKESKQRKT